MPGMASQVVHYTDRQKVIRRLLRKGWSSGQIARKLAPNDPKKRVAIRGSVRRVVQKDAEYQARQVAEAHGLIFEHLPRMTEAQIKRALRGRTDALKLLLEVSGIHNPKVKHEHSGGLELKIVAIPRPDPVDNTPQRRQLDEPIVDAEVVDED